MVEIELDGQKVEIAEGSMVMHAAEKAGTYIPHFCYHKKLSIPWIAPSAIKVASASCRIWPWATAHLLRATKKKSA